MQPYIQNYVNYVKLGCQLLNVSTEAFNTELIKKAAMAIVKRSQFAQRPRFFIRLPLVRSLMEIALTQQDKTGAMLYLVSYAFLLRVPSEALPIAKSSSGVSNGAEAIMYMSDNVLYFKLTKRKNRINGCLLKQKNLLVQEWQAYLPYTCTWKVL